MAEFDEHPAGATCVLRASGYIDMEAADHFRDRLLDCLDRFDVVEVDLGAVTFIDSTGLGALVRLRTEAATRGKRTALRNLSPAADRILQVSGLRNLFAVATD